MNDYQSDWCVTGFSGTKYLNSELKETFDGIAPLNNWKDDFNHEVNLNGISVVKLLDTIIHFTGTNNVNISLRPNGRVHITCDGYYKTIGA